ncbi:MAG: hypothetical protein ACTSPB_21405, partial [Candidatus Thorarchaeota archaeon]
NSTLEFTIPAQDYDTNVSYYFIVTDEASNVATSTNFTYRVNDTTAPTISSVIKNVTSPEYGDDVLITATVTEPTAASGVDMVVLWTNATGAWTSTQMVAGTGDTYSASILAQPYDTNVSYYVKANDTENNTQTSSSYYYIVGDTVQPTISDVTRNSTNPEYNETVLVWCTVTDHDPNASGIDTVLLKYQNVTAGTFYDIIMAYDASSGTWNGTIPEHVYDTKVNYKIVANDSAGNTQETSVSYYTVIDSYAPQLGTISQDPSGIISYTQSVTVNITAMDDDAPNGGSGIYSVVFNYSTDGGQSWTSANVNSTLEYTISSQPYDTNVTYHFIVTDKASNIAVSSNYTYRVNDTIAPTIGTVSRNVTNPEYSDAIRITATVSEPATASGIKKVYLNYSINDGAWISIDITATKSGNEFYGDINDLAWNTTVNYAIKAVDNEDNVKTQSSNYSYTVGDTVAPTYTQIQRSNTSPGNNESVEVNVTIPADSEPLNASGIQSVEIYHRAYTGTPGAWTVDNMVNFTTVYNFTISGEPSGSTVEYYVNITDRAGNSKISTTYSYEVGSTITIGDVLRNPSTPNYNQTVTINVTEVSTTAPLIEHVILNYSYDGGSTWYQVELNNTSDNNHPNPHTFNDYAYGTVMQYYINVTDSLNASSTTTIFQYTVIDSYAPELGTVSRNETNVFYYQAVNVSISSILEPLNSSGIDTNLLRYMLNDRGTWNEIVLDGDLSAVIPAQSYSTNVKYKIFANDSAGNEVESAVFSYDVGDDVDPTFGTLSRDIAAPEYDDSVTFSIGDVNEPTGASGISTVKLYYSIDGNQSYITKSMVSNGTH